MRSDFSFNTTRKEIRTTKMVQNTLIYYVKTETAKHKQDASYKPMYYYRDYLNGAET